MGAGVRDFTVTGEKGFRLSDYPTSLRVDGDERPAWEERLARNKARIEELQDPLYAEARESVIVILQAMDAAGKDSTIRHVLGGINPTGIDVRSFKQPTSIDREHGFLWRSFSALPARGKIAVFNRSYYEECLVVRVHGLWRDYQLPDRCRDMGEKRYFRERFEDIRGFERYLWRTGNRIVKVFLNVSADKQRERFLERIDDPAKNWKFSESDLSERMEWDEYQAAYEEMIAETATERAPWLVLPADQKWVARTLFSEALLQVLEDMDPRYPELPRTSLDRLDECRAALVDGPAADVDD
ncbi:polyphosphate kinase 2 family protein [Olsenella uli]|uniref:PPK2 family polyphosphate kinase n=1 Tax=Olsenella uli TaxID=133926 RepID=UPI00195CADBA|nr:PPK2 family polyphosphate kinase [Olsenella uli]MBM6816588.1 polyphosphate kinase 2 family protein [Olsenella uli]